MRSVVIPGLLLALAACDSPSHAFRDAPARHVRVEGSRFTVRRSITRVEAIRTSREPVPARSVIERKAERAIGVATGCRVRALAGDAAIQLARLDC